MSRLAVHGGSPVRDPRPWPAWPQYDEATERELVAALRSRRWAVSWPTDGTPARERRFAERFAAYNGVPYCVSVDHGSSALVVALEALDVGPGDEVVVPVMTWVAPVAAVLRVGALPVLVDVDPETGCMTAGAIRAAASEKTKAAIAVHLACTVADLDEIVAATEDLGIALIEDCAQAHGARWRGRNVGTYGALGAFSFQVGKVLAAGEGGAVVTSDERLHRRAQMLRADSRRYPDGEVAPGTMELVEDGEVMGGNYCMSELSASVLLDQLPRLDDQHRRREDVARALEDGMAALGDFGPIPVPGPADRRSIYEYGIRVREGTFGEVAIGRVAEALSAEVGLPIWPPDLPLDRSPMLRPETKRRFAAAWTAQGARRALGREYPGAERYAASTLIFHHSALLGDATDAEDLVRGLEKVRGCRDDL